MRTLLRILSGILLASAVVLLIFGAAFVRCPPSEASLTKVISDWMPVRGVWETNSKGFAVTVDMMNGNRPEEARIRRKAALQLLEADQQVMEIDARMTLLKSQRSGIHHEHRSSMKRYFAGAGLACLCGILLYFASRIRGEVRLKFD